MPQVECSHRVGYNSVPYRFTSILPIPHTLFFPPACYSLATPFRNTVVARGATDAIDAILFRGVFLNFPKSPPFLYSLPHFFSFYGGKYRNYCIYCRTACFEPKFDRRVKKRSVAEVLHSVVNLLHEIPRSVLDWWSGWGCRWCCAIVWCNRSRWEYCSGVVPTTAPLLAVLWC